LQLRVDRIRQEFGFAAGTDRAAPAWGQLSLFPQEEGVAGNPAPPPLVTLQAAGTAAPGGAGRARCGIG
jgi:hypothetical protein